MGIFGKSWNDKFNAESNFQREMLQNEQDFTERMWNQTNDWNLAQWNRENEYNTPAAQMQRFLDAGINPNDAAQAIAGSDSSAGNIQASAPSSPSAPSAPDPSGQGFFDDAMGLANTVMGVAKYFDSERDLTKAETEEKKESVEVMKTERKKLDEEVRDLVYKNDYLNPETKRQIIASYEKLEAEKLLTEEQRSEVRERVNLMVKQQTEIDKKIAAIDQEIKESDERIKLIKEQVNTEQAQQDKIGAETQLIGAQKERTEIESQLTDLQAERQDLQNQFEGYLQSLATSIDDKRSTVDKYGSNLGSMGKSAAGKSTNVRVNKRYKSRYRSNNHKNPNF